MLSQTIPSTVSSEEGVKHPRSAGGLLLKVASPPAAGGGSSRSAGGLTIRSVRAAANEPLRVQFHQQVGFEGSRLDPRILQGRDGPGWIRGALRTSGARCAGTGCRRQRASERDRCVLIDAVALFGRTGSAVDGIVRDQRDSEGRSGGACHPDGYGKSTCRARRYGDVRRTRSQVPDLGARALPCALGGGAHEGPRPEESIGQSNFGTEVSAEHLTRSAGAMMGRGDGPGAGAAGGPSRHVPVLLAEVGTALDANRGGVFIDGTFGAGGYTRAILDAHPQNKVIAIDRDPDAIAGGASLAAKFKKRLMLVPGRFGDLDEVARAQGSESVDGVVLDIGVSSMQLDQAERGFSFRNDGPLDMRMEREGPSAADLTNESSEAELADIFYHYGEERGAHPGGPPLHQAR